MSAEVRYEGRVTGVSVMRGYDVISDSSGVIRDLREGEAGDLRECEGVAVVRRVAGLRKGRDKGLTVVAEGLTFRVLDYRETGKFHSFYISGAT